MSSLEKFQSRSRIVRKGCVRFQSLLKCLGQFRVGCQLGDGDIVPMSDGEVAANAGGRAGFTLERGWENWCREVGRPYYPMDWNMGPGFSKTDK